MDILTCFVPSTSNGVFEEAPFKVTALINHAMEVFSQCKRRDMAMYQKSSIHGKKRIYCYITMEYSLDILKAVIMKPQYHTENQTTY